MYRSDPAERETDVLIGKVEKRIAKEYSQAESELTLKLNDYLAKFQKKNKTWQEWVQDGKKTEEEYQKWRIGQVAIGERWEELRDSISKDLINTNKIARSITDKYMPEAYALNHDYATFEIEKGSLVDTSYTLYSREAAERVFRDNPKMLPPPGKRVSQKIADGLAKRWNNQQIQSTMIQALLQGESIPKIATRLTGKVGNTFTIDDIKDRDKKTAKQVAKELARKNRQAAIRNARTMMTGAQNAGRLDAIRRANDMGIKAKKQWMATLDMRTRHWHRELDGVTLDENEPFENEYGEIMFPGDTSAEPANIYNCRCKLVTAIEGFEDDMSDITWRHNKNLGNMTYEEWKEGHGKSEPILKQEEVGNAIRMRYINEYRGRR